MSINPIEPVRDAFPEGSVLPSVPAPAISTVAQDVFSQPPAAPNPNRTWTAKVISFFKGILARIWRVFAAILPRKISGAQSRTETYKWDEKETEEGYGPNAMLISTSSKQCQKDLDRQAFYVDGKKFVADANKKETGVYEDYKKQLKELKINDEEIGAVELFTQQGVALWGSKKGRKNHQLSRGEPTPGAQNYNVKLVNDQIEVISNWVLSDIETSEDGLGTPFNVGVAFVQVKATIPRGNLKHDCLKGTVVKYYLSETEKYDEPFEMQNNDIPPKFQEKAHAVLKNVEGRLKGQPPLIWNSIVLNPSS